MANAAATVERAVRAAHARVPDLFARGTRLVVGFSGGQDSTCLLHALRRCMAGVELIAAHVDHGLRPDSAADAQRVVALAASVGVPTEVTRVDVAAYRVGRSVQHAARCARYQALASLVERLDAAALLVAHTADDQAETVLLNLVRGTGLKGLGGMRLDETIDPRQLAPTHGVGVPSALRVARPLLRIERTTTLAYCTDFGLAIVEDASNRSRTFTRNRVRLDVLPVLERFNPAIRQVLARTADLVADDMAALDSVVLDLHAALASQPAPDVLAYDRAAWCAQPRGLQRRLLRRGLECLLGTLEDVPAAPIEDALDVVASNHPGRTYHLPYGVELVSQASAFELRLHGAAQARHAKNQVKDLPGV